MERRLIIVLKRVLLVMLGIGLVSSVLCPAFVSVTEMGTWPGSWPAELQAYRQQARTLRVAHGIQETVYEIPFEGREAFEAAWPHILKVRSKGAPLILERPPSYYGVSGSTMGAGVRILAPAMGVVSLPDGTELPTFAPWPESVRLPTGALPEYVMARGAKWVPFEEDGSVGFRYRARVDIVLVTDAQVIDLNRIPLPPGTPIIDRRFADMVAPGDTETDGVPDA